MGTGSRSRERLRRVCVFGYRTDEASVSLGRFYRPLREDKPAAGQAPPHSVEASVVERPPEVAHMSEPPKGGSPSLFVELRVRLHRYLLDRINLGAIDH